MQVPKPKVADFEEESERVEGMDKDGDEGSVYRSESGSESD